MHQILLTGNNPGLESVHGMLFEHQISTSMGLSEVVIFSVVSFVDEELGLFWNYQGTSMYEDKLNVKTTFADRYKLVTICIRAFHVVVWYNELLPAEYSRV